MRRRVLKPALAVACAAAVLAAPTTAGAFSPETEIANFAKTFERELYVSGTPEFQLELRLRSLEALVERTEQIANDPERVPANACGIKGLECAGDIRFHDWHEQSADAIRKSVLFTARSGATLSGHVWATQGGPAQKPGIVITTGSVQAPEELYWGQAATLAKHGYVVLTYDVQGQGGSDTFGEGDDQFESVPAQNGGPFYDNTEDALDFLLSNPGSPYVPRPSCSTGTSHAAKQDRRVSEGFNAAYNPLHDRLDASRIGIAGHSFGAAGVSFVGQKDPRVDAIVAWDNLSIPGATPAGGRAAPPCEAAPQTRESPPITKPGLGISNDYGIAAEPFTADPDPQEKNEAFDAYREAGVDSGEVVIRGGCHEESAFLPLGLTGPYPIPCGTLRGGDLIAWYTTAWFDKYVKGDAGADARLLSDRWRDDAPGRAVDLNSPPDGNLYSFYFRSVLDIGLAGGGRAACDDLRSGCAALGPDGAPVPYDFVADAWDTGPGGSGPPVGGSTGADPSAGKAQLKKGLKRCKRKKSKRARRRCIDRALEKLTS